MPKTLLPIWSEYKKSLNLDKKEVAETFHFISDVEERRDYELAKKALDSITGSREWLKSYVTPEDEMPFFDGMGPRVMTAFGSHHSGESAIELGLNYKYILNNWDKFVFDTKVYYAKRAYYSRQLSIDIIKTYIPSQIINMYRLPYSLHEVKKMIDDLYDEFEANSKT
jgi:hypothetical protein